MTRIFAPSTPDSFLRRDGIAVVLLLIHAIAAGFLMAPLVESTSREELLDRLVVFLIPPDDPAPRDASEGTGGWSGATEGDGVAGGAVQPTDEPMIERRGDIPALTASALELAGLDEQPEDALTVLEVDSAVVRDPTSAAPEYPAHLLNSGLEGLAEVRYVVDTLGIVDTLSYRVLKASHIDFAVAVRRALPNMRFRPALQGGRRVRQLVEQTFRFKITPQADRVIVPDDTAAPRQAPSR